MNASSCQPLYFSSTSISESQLDLFAPPPVDPSVLVSKAGGSPAPAATSGLGNDTESRKRFKFKSRSEVKRNLSIRFNRMRTARELLPGERVSKCGTVVLSQDYQIGAKIADQNVKIPILNKDGNFYFGGLMRCESVWVCPECARIITSVRAEELRSACKAARQKGLQYFMLTLTVPHYSNNSLNQVLIGICKALRTLKNRKAWKTICNSLGYQGDIRTLEVTYAKVNGWHPHFHILVFVSVEVDRDYLKKLILKEWKKVCLDLHIPEPNIHGVDVQLGHDAIEEYIAKWGHEPTQQVWDVDSEMTKGHTLKSSASNHVTPFGLLDLFSIKDKKGLSVSPWAGEKFQEFAKEFKGKRQLVWTRGLKKLLDVKEKSDEEILAEEEKAEIFIHITWSQYQLICAAKKEAEALCICSCGIDAFKEWLQKLTDDLIKFPKILH